MLLHWGQVAPAIKRFLILVVIQEDFFGQSSCYHTAIDRLCYPSIGIHDPNF